MTAGQLPLEPRRARPASPVSVIVPCFNHGVFLDECLESVFAQTVPASEVILVDDGSTDQHTLSTLDRVEREGRVSVVRQPNQGPSAARNRGIALATGDLILPVDADNRLAPAAIAALLETMLASPDEVRFVYPHQQFFGNRTDLAIMPEFNLYLLLQHNFCDTGSLIDRSVFDAGCSFREDIGLGHEDWDFFLTVTEHGFLGTPCHDHVLDVRKHGFTRSELVHHQFGSFLEEIRELHPDLFGPEQLLTVKQKWCPALSLVMDQPAASLATSLDQQTLQDFEVVGASRLDGRFSDARQDPGPGDDDGGRGNGSLWSQLATARGRWILLLPDASAEQLGDRALLEKGVQLAQHTRGSAAIGLALGHSPRAHNWRPLEEPGTAERAGLLVETELVHDLLPSVSRDGPESLVDRLVEAINDSRRARVQWRTLHSTSHAVSTTVGPDPARETSQPAPVADPPTAAPAGTAGQRKAAARSAEVERSFRQRQARPLSFGYEKATRLPRPRHDTTCGGWLALQQEAWSGWTPPHTERLGFVLQPEANRYVLVSGSVSDADTIGRVYTQAFPGTVSFWKRTNLYTGGLSYWLGDEHDDGLFDSLGHLSTAHLPGMTYIGVAVEDRLDRERRRLGGRPLPRFHLGGEVIGAFLEPTAPPPVSVDGDDRKASTTLWTLYEAVAPNGRVSYSTHPDAAPALAGSRLGRARAVARLPSPDQGDARLYEVVHRQSGARMYLGDLRHAGDPAYFASSVLGSFASPEMAAALPLVRLSPHPGCAVAPDAGYRLAVGVQQSLLDSGLRAEGIMGLVVPPRPERRPLYRWRHRTRHEWRYSLSGGLPASMGDEWVFDCTVGLAFAPMADWAGLIDLAELRNLVTDAITYACTDGTAPANHKIERVVGRLHATQDPGMAPLFQGTAGGDAALFTLNPDEATAAGLAPVGPVAFVGLAVPPHARTETSAGLGGVRPIRVEVGQSIVDGVVAEAPGPGLRPLVRRPDATPGLVVRATGDRAGPAEDIVGYVSECAFAYCLPLYELGLPGQPATAVSTEIEGLEVRGYRVQRVVGFVGSRDDQALGRVVHPAPEQLALRTRLGRVARRTVRHLPPPARSRLATAWHEIERTGLPARVLRARR